MAGKTEGFDNLSWQEASAEERLNSYFVGDPANDYIGFPEIRRSIILEGNVEDVSNVSRSSATDLDTRHRSRLLGKDLVSGRPEKELRRNMEHLGVIAVEAAATA
jgi:hypothetical protein